MLRKFTIIAASTALLTFGGAFSNAAEASPVEKELAYKVYYSINGETGSFTQDEAASLVKKAFERIQTKFLTNVDFKELKKELVQQAPVKEEPKKEEVKQPAPEKEQPAEEKEQQPAPKEEAPVNETPEPVQNEAPVNETPEPVQNEAPVQPQSQQPQQPAEETQQESSLSEFEVQVVELTNQERAKSGLAPLQIDEDLSVVARDKSRDMAANNYFDHNSPVHGSPFDMMQSYGINYRTAGENIAKGQRSPEEVVNAWMNSPGHRANIMNGDFTHIGVGFVEQGNHWTQMFIGK